MVHNRRVRTVNPSPSLGATALKNVQQHPIKGQLLRQLLRDLFRRKTPSMLASFEQHLCC